MNTRKICSDLYIALCNYEEKRVLKRGYNTHALEHYANSIEKISVALEAGQDLKTAFEQGFIFEKNRFVISPVNRVFNKYAKELLQSTDK
jgi:hypothetical protein